MTCVSTLWPILDRSPPTHRCLLFAVNTSNSFVNDPIPKLGPPVLVDCPPRLCIRPTATAPATLVDPNRGLLHCHPPRENWSGLSSIRDSSGGVQRRTCARSHRMQHCRQFSTTAKLRVMAGTMTKKRCEAIYPCINSLINYLQIKLWKGWWTGSSKKKKNGTPYVSIYFDTPSFVLVHTIDHVQASRCCNFISYVPHDGGEWRLAGERVCENRVNVPSGGCKMTTTILPCCGECLMCKD